MSNHYCISSPCKICFPDPIFPMPTAPILTQDLIKKYSQYIHIKGIEHPDIGKGYTSGVKDVLFSENGVRIGKLYLESDGVWYFWPEETNGYIPDYIMIAIGSIMLELNNIHII